MKAIGKVLLFFAFLACHSERSERTCFLPFFVRATQKACTQ